jgi:hypothetical protein
MGAVSLYVLGSLWETYEGHCWNHFGVMLECVGVTNQGGHNILGSPTYWGPQYRLGSPIFWEPNILWSPI